MSNIFIPITHYFSFFIQHSENKDLQLPNFNIILHPHYNLSISNTKELISHLFLISIKLLISLLNMTLNLI